MKYVLASSSERRQQLLKRLIKNFEIVVSEFDEESIEFSGDVERYVMDLATGKGKSSLDLLDYDAIVIAADTIVVYEGNLLGKPKNEEDAFRILRMLSGNSHEVYTGFVIIDSRNKNIIKDVVRTKVTFSDITDEEIKEYIKTNEPMDKAAAYGIQGLGGVFVEKIEGCYYNVVGLPLNRLKKQLKKMAK